MEKSQSITSIAKALITFHLKVEKVGRDANNPFFKSKYASLSNILEVINKPLTESGLSFAQFPIGTHGLTTILMHGESGEYLEATYDMVPVKNDPQGHGSALTYQRRYALASVLGLNIDDDDDGNAASAKPAPPKQQLTDLQKAIEGMKTATDVKAFAAGCPEEIQQNQNFKDAGNDRYKQLNTKK